MNNDEVISDAERAYVEGVINMLKPVPIPLSFAVWLEVFNNKLSEDSMKKLHQLLEQYCIHCGYSILNKCCSCKKEESSGLVIEIIGTLSLGFIAYVITTYILLVM